MLVSAILPTRGRREWAQQAVDCFLAQTYSEKELIILDDCDDRSFSEAPKHKWIDYWIVDPNLNIPRKRNSACQATGGKYIIHFDSDDYSVPERMAEQVDFIRSSGKAVAGYSDLLIYDTMSDQVYQYKSPRKDYAVGTSLIYRRDWWQTHAFNANKPIGSDTEFVFWAAKEKQIATQSGLGKIVARLHPDTSGRGIKDGMWDSLHGTGKKSPSLMPVAKEQLPRDWFIPHGVLDYK